MPFTIELQAPTREHPEADNVTLAAEMRRAFSSITDVPLDHELIAREYARVPRDEVLNHWAQIELHGDGALGNPIIALWLSAAFIELSSTPAESCEERLRRVEPVLVFFRERGFTVPTIAELVAAYEEQRQQAATVARMIGGRIPNG